MIVVGIILLLASALVIATTIGVGLLAVVSIAWLWQHYHFAYWERLKVPNITATPFVGNVGRLLRYKCCFGDQFRELYDAPAAAGQPYIGIHVLHNHAILLREPALIKRILIEDFSDFSSRFETADAIGDPMGSQNLFFAKYNTWRDIHKIFTPLFAAGKIRQMYPLLQQIGQQLEEHMASRLGKSESQVIEVKELCALFTTDVIASLAFGIEARILKNPNAEFRQMCVEVNDPRPKRILHLFTMFFFPSCSRWVRTHLYSTDYEKFMRQSMDFIMSQREASGVQRNDLIDIFIHLRRTQPPESVVHRPDFYVAQAAFLLLAGFDTSSSTITFALYELAKQPNIQLKLRNELANALASNGGQLGYETITNALPYLRQVVEEVMHLYPPTSFLDRCCNAKNGYSLSPWGNNNHSHLPTGTPVYISVLGLHRDPQYWPNPDHFDPDRFSPEQRSQHTPMAYLPFGAGPRGCIGTLLGLLEVKLGLLHILKNYRVEFCSQSLPQMKFDPKTFVLAADGGTFLNFVKDKL